MVELRIVVCFSSKYSYWRYSCCGHVQAKPEQSNFEIKKIKHRDKFFEIAFRHVELAGRCWYKHKVEVKYSTGIKNDD
jgi:hypothetical protein